MKKLIATLLAFSMLLPLAACNSDDEEEQGGQPGVSPEMKQTYYSSKTIRIPKSTDELFVLPKGDKVCIMSMSYNYEFECDGEINFTDIYDYGFYICNYDGQIEKEFDAKLPKNCIIADMCDLDENRFVTVGDGADFIIFDYDGNVLKQGDNSVKNDVQRRVGKTSDGFIVQLGNSVSLYDMEGNFIDDLEFDENAQINGVFGQNGKYYGYSEMFEDSPATDGMFAEYEGKPYYYEFDFENDSVEKLERPDSYSDTFFLNWAGGCFRNLISGDSFTDSVVEYDIESGTVVPLALKSNMLVAPPSAGGYDYTSPTYKVIDHEHFYRDYIYHADQYDLSEVALISVDESLHLDQREEIVIQGVGISDSTVMQAALYDYNTSQDQYFVKYDDIGYKYELYENEDNAAAKADLMTQYSNGNTPDMFFGNFFDYNYMGENNLVLDLKPYLGNDSIYDKMTRDDGKIYQTWAGFYLSGYFGRDDIYSSNNVSLTEMPVISKSTERFENYSTTDELFFNLFGTDLCRLYREGKLTKENIKAALTTAIESGRNPTDDDDYYTYDTSAEDVGTGTISLYLDSVGSPSSYEYLCSSYGSNAVFVGYPSIGRSIHMMLPVGLMAVSSSTDHPEACIDFIKTLMTDDVQRRVCGAGIIPASRDILMENLDLLQHPEKATDEQKIVYDRTFIWDYCGLAEPEMIPMSADMAASYLEQIDAADTVETYDWGLMIVTKEEISTYYSQGKSIDQVADSLYSRYLVYAQENYG